MKALLIKDFYMLKKYCRVLLFIVCLFPLMAFGEEDTVIFIFYPVMLAGMMATSTLSYDERFKWLNFCDSTPISRALIVAEKYLLSLILSLLVTGIILLVFLIRTFTGSANAADVLSVLSMVTAFALLSPALMLPAFFKLGVEKGRLVYYIGFGILFAVAFILPTDSGAALSLSGPAALVLPPLLGALLFGLSWLLSHKFYKAREL